MFHVKHVPMGTLIMVYYQSKRWKIKMRKFMTKEVAVTKVMVGTVGLDENMLPKVENIETVELLGELDKEKATKKYTKSGGTKTVFNVTVETRTYKMKVEDFIKIAELVTDDDTDTDDDDEDESEDTPVEQPKEEPKTRRINKTKAE